jgi:hypothetical protein
MKIDLTKCQIKETKLTLKKFVGDGPPDRTDEPYEERTYVDGKLVAIIHRDVPGAPKPEEDPAS